MTQTIVAHSQPVAQANPAPHITKPVVAIHATRGEYHAKLAGGGEVPVSRRQALALIARARDVQYWSFGIYQNWVLHGAVDA